MQKTNTYILAIESSCDDTSCAVLCNTTVLSNVTANQKIHEQYGGVVPELASRDHQKNIVPVVDAALKEAGVTLSQLQAIAVTCGPGLMGSLLVGLNFAKSLALSLNIPLIQVDHMQAHIMAHFIDNDEQRYPQFPFLCLTVSGGHTQLVLVKGIQQFELIGETIDDAIGEAFDKAAKILGLPYPGGPLIDKHSKDGDTTKYKFADSKLQDYNFSFSGVKTSFLYFIQKEVAANPTFIKDNLNHICASYQNHLVQLLIKKTKAVLIDKEIIHLAIAGGVSANSELRKQIKNLGTELNVHTYIPSMEYCTDNAAMIGIVGYHKFLLMQFADLGIAPVMQHSI